ncbi:hypothetical protein DICPUDRAFT_88261 [Dictyostelium purpureum]|uniref:AD domain-containing protein n=1 Tax=Dictyostelium purpureum TaxID=5786 RepID=F0ZNA9_DICPU|nr:uncharacterized protein DICPUDRAFT_88261 [Dictyostelium purpureum]EGC34582.1 hypothetical protein DICPUDRAFT_88261 [Dictyostelium purpureum]|eukprot:XP_003288906.1 hypothetical protein DICPUDRAFT_88261 [Dictyostelium purpureum]
MEDKFSWIVGLKVLIKTTSNDEFEGEVFNYDPVTTCITLLSDESTSAVITQKRTVRVLLESSIADIKCLSLPTNTVPNVQSPTNKPQPNISSNNVDLTLPPINVQLINKKQDEIIRKATQQAMKIGVGVTSEAQEIFNSLSKTLPCTWSGDNIIVLGEIKISSPYNIDNCTGPENSKSLDRVKKVLQAERKKLNK